MRRHLLGAIAILFLGVGLVLWLYSDADFAWVSLRIGMVLAAIWLALPQVIETFSRIPRWAFLVGALAVAAAAISPKALLVVIPIIAGIGLLHFVKWLFKPPAARRAGRHSRPDK